MKIKKSFRNHADLSLVKNEVEVLLTFYSPDVTLGDIFKNVMANEEKWEECKRCNGTGVIRKDLGIKKATGKRKQFGFFPCDKCKGKKWIRIKNKKEGDIE